MKLEVKLSWLWVLLIPAVMAGVIWWYISTDVVRQYKARNEEMKMVYERNDLEIKIIRQFPELTKLRRDGANAPGQIPVAPPQVQ